MPRIPGAYWNEPQRELPRPVEVKYRRTEVINLTDGTHTYQWDWSP